MSDQANLAANPADAGSWRACGLRLAAGSRTLVEALSLAFGPGELWCIAGPNGAGKTTLISVLAGLAEPAAGHVEADGRPLRAWRPEALARRRALMAQTHHDAFAASVFDTVLAHRFPHLGGWGWEREADRAAAREALARLDLAALAARNVLTLSGGERQRVALAGPAREVLTAEAASAAFGYPLLLIERDGHEALVPAWPAQPRRGRAAP